MSTSSNPNGISTSNDNVNFKNNNRRQTGIVLGNCQTSRSSSIYSDYREYRQNSRHMRQLNSQERNSNSNALMALVDSSEHQKVTRSGITNLLNFTSSQSFIINKI